MFGFMDWFVDVSDTNGAIRTSKHGDTVNDYEGDDEEMAKIQMTDIFELPLKEISQYMG